MENLNFNELDKDLSEQERNEWNSIYASYRARSALTGRVVGMDNVSMPVRNPDTDKPENQTVHCLVVIAYRVKVLIPETEVWFSEETSRPPHVLRSMTGAMIDYVVTAFDRTGECAVASRREALGIRRRMLAKRTPKPGAKIYCRILAVGRTHLLAEAGGFDLTLTQRDLSYAMIPDLRAEYRPGGEYPALVKKIDLAAGTLAVSIKEAEPHPFDGADIRHPVGCRRASRITGKYGGGVFCRLDKNLDCMCVYSSNQLDSDFAVGDDCIIVITRYEYSKKQVYAKIVAKW
jgi:ribosomal protein S1